MEIDEVDEDGSRIWHLLKVGSKCYDGSSINVKNKYRNKSEGKDIEIERVWEDK